MSHQHGGSSLRVGHASPGATLPLRYPSHQSGLAQTPPARSTAPTFTRSILYLQAVTSQKSVLSPEKTISLLKPRAALLPQPAGRAPMPGHPGVLRRREGNTLVPQQPRERGGCGEGEWGGPHSQGGVTHQTPPSVMAAFIIIFHG